MTALRLVPAADGEVGPADSRSKLRVVLADGHEAMRRNLRALLEAEADMSVVAEAADIPAAARCVASRRPDVLVIDRRMPGGASLDLVREVSLDGLEESGHLTAVVVLTLDENPLFAHQSLSAGALGYVRKELADEELPSAVRSAARGMRYVAPSISTRLRAPGRSPFVELTPRETEVLRLIALGHTSVEIAGALEISPRTVESHRARIHGKLGLETRAELVQQALRRGLMTA